MSKKRMSIIFVLFLFLLPTMVLAREINFSWYHNTEPDLDHYDLYISSEPGIYNGSSWNGPEEECILELSEGVYYVVLTATDQSGNESGYSPEVRFEIRGNDLYYVPIEYQQEDNGIRFFLPDAQEAGVAGFILYYTKDGITEFVDIGTVTEYFLVMDEGAYNFHLVPYSLNGDEYNSYSAAFNELWPPLEKPELKVEYVGIGLNTLVLAGIKPADDARIDYYEYQMASTYAKAQVGEADYTENGNIVEGVSSLNEDYNIVFLSVFPVAGSPDTPENNVVGDSEIAYVLFGNIIGTYNDGVSWDVCDVGYPDYNVLKGTYNSHVDRPTFAEYVNYDLYDLLPFTLTERADMDGEGNVLYPDYNFLKIKYGHIGADYTE